MHHQDCRPEPKWRCWTVTQRKREISPCACKPPPVTRYRPYPSDRGTYHSYLGHDKLRCGREIRRSSGERIADGRLCGHACEDETLRLVIGRSHYPNSRDGSV